MFDHLLASVKYPAENRGVYIAAAVQLARCDAMAEADAQVVAVPYADLAPELLHAVVESYVLREGTDYGEREFSLAEKVAHVIGLLARGEAQIVFDPETESVSIVGAREHRPVGRNGI